MNFSEAVSEFVNPYDSLQKPTHDKYNGPAPIPRNILIDETKLGYFGLAPNEVNVLKRMFASVDIIKTTESKRYDIYIFDITYASRRIIDYISRSFPAPMVIISTFNEPKEVLKSIPENAYLRLHSREELLEIGFKEKLGEYLNNFMKYKKDFMQDSVINEIDEILRQGGTLNKPVTEEKIMTQRDIWRKWRKEYE